MLTGLKRNALLTKNTFRRLLHVKSKLPDHHLCLSVRVREGVLPVGEDDPPGGGGVGRVVVEAVEVGGAAGGEPPT